MGPIEILAFEFPGNQFSGEILPALQAVVDKGVIRVIDLAIVKKGQDGAVTAVELEHWPGAERSAFDNVAADIADLLNKDDLEQIGEELDPNSTAAVLVFEHTWASDVREAIVRANGRLLLRQNVPP